jgi:hypothetical protein
MRVATGRVGRTPFALSTPWTPSAGKDERNEVSNNARDDEPDPEDTGLEEGRLSHEAEAADEEAAAVEVDGGGPTHEEREEIRHLPEGLLKRLASEPARAPQYLALAAVDRWGEQARKYAGRVRREHPEATSRQLAQMVRSRHALLARMEGASAGIPPTVAPGPGTVAVILPDVAALAWLQSRMVVQIAAVYGHDTTDEEMAAELLVLQRFYNTTAAARVAVTEASKRVAQRVITTYIKGSTLLLLKQLFRYVGIKFTRVGLLKAVPYIAIPLGAVINESATRSLANRAIKFYDLQPVPDPHAGSTGVRPFAQMSATSG